MTTPDERPFEASITVEQRLDRIEARQILLYEKLAGIRSPLSGPARHDLIEEWNAPKVRKPPKRAPTKEVEVWRVDYAIPDKDGWVPVCGAYATESEAHKWAARYSRTCQCIRVTGPHRQTVPT